MAGSLPSRERAAKAQVPNSCIYAVGAGRLTLQGSFINPLPLLFSFLLFSVPSYFPFQCVFSCFSVVPNPFSVSGQSSKMLIASELGFRKQKLPHLGIREALLSGSLHCAGIWEWDERCWGRGSFFSPFSHRGDGVCSQLSHYLPCRDAICTFLIHDSF